MKKCMPILIFLAGFFAGIPAVLADFANQPDTTFIYLGDYGIQKARKKNCVPIIQRAISNLQGDNPKVLVFPRGEYHFYPESSSRKVYFESNTTDINPKVCAFLFENIQNLVIDGRGSNLIFHGQMQPFTLDNCSNIILKNINIDWEQPLTAQGQVLKTNDEFIEISIDLKQFPYRIDNGKLFFYLNRNQFEPWKGTMEFDRAERYIVPQTGDDGCLGQGWENYLAENVIPGIIRLYFPFERKPAVGNFLVFRHAERIHAGIFITESKNIIIQNVNLYHATGLGVLAQFSENLTLNKYRAVPNKAKNRYFGGGDDGLQVSNCRGKVVVNHCEFAGLMDDPVNVHGTSVKIIEKISDRKLRCKFMHHQSVGLNWGHPGDKISFIENETMQSQGTAEIVNFKSLNSEFFEVTFQTPVPAGIEKDDALENLTWTPDVEIRNSQFKSCRARGILVSTPGKVVIENNIFESSGSAILIAGDANKWFESGAVTDVLIRNNLFTELCNTSAYQFCEGIISIYPEIPALNEQTPQFHKNIRIEHNEFHPFDFSVLFARSVDGLSFENNKVTRSTRFEPWHKRQYNFTFEACKNVSLSNNRYSEDLPGKIIYLKWTPREELSISEEMTFTIGHFGTK